MLCCPTLNPTSFCFDSNGCVTPTEYREGPVVDTEIYAYEDLIGLHICSAASVVYEMERCLFIDSDISTTTSATAA